MGLFNDEDYAAGGRGTWFKFVDEGDTLEGRIVNIARDVSGNFGDQDVYDIVAEDNETYKVSATLKSVLGIRLREANLHEGDLVGIKFIGKVKTKNGRWANGWEIAVKRQDATVTPLREQLSKDKARRAAAVPAGGLPEEPPF